MSKKKKTTYTEAQLIAFGNYLLSKERKESIVNEANQEQVTDADLRNWKGGEE